MLCGSGLRVDEERRAGEDGAYCGRPASARGVLDQEVQRRQATRFKGESDVRVMGPSD